MHTIHIVSVITYGLQKPSRPCSKAINTCLKSLNPRAMAFPIKTLFQNTPFSPS